MKNIPWSVFEYQLFILMRSDALETMASNITVSNGVLIEAIVYVNDSFYKYTIRQRMKTR